MIAPPNSVAATKLEIQGMTTDELRNEFRQGLRLSVEYLTRLALVFVELESRGEEVQGVHDGLLSFLRSIAKGELLAEIVVTFASSPRILGQMRKLPIEEQRRIVEDQEECERLTKPAKRKKRKSRRESEVQIEEKHFLSLAKVSLPKDLASLIAEMIVLNDHPAEVWAALENDEKILDLKRRFASAS